MAIINMNAYTKALIQLPSLRKLQTPSNLTQKNSNRVSKPMLGVRIRKTLTNNIVVKRKSELGFLEERINSNISPIGCKNFSFIQDEEEDFHKIVQTLTFSNGIH